MKIVMIILPSPWLISDRDCPVLGPLYVAGAVREAGYEVQVADLSGIPEQYWFIPKGDIYAISATTPQHIYAKKVVKLLRKREPKCQIIAGGMHPTVLPKRVLDLGINQVVRGEGEKAIIDIINGKKDKIIEAPLIEDIDKLPLPARDLVDSFSYHKLGTNSVMGDTPKMREGYIFTARGCPFKCAFCCQAAMWKRRVRQRSIEKVMEEVDLLMNDYGVDRIYFEDDTFIISKKRVEKFCEAIYSRHKKGLDWHCLSRVDLADLELYKKMKWAGCKQITYGIESFSNKTLKTINKLTTAEQNLKGIQIAKKAGLKVRAQMIVGIPGETWEDIKENEKYMKIAPADSWGIHILMPFPGSDIWDNPEKYNIKIDKDTEFEDYHTIGKKEVHEVVLQNPPPKEVIKWKKYLMKIAGKKEISKWAERRKNAE